MKTTDYSLVVSYYRLTEQRTELLQFNRARVNTRKCVCCYDNPHGTYLSLLY